MPPGRERFQSGEWVAVQQEIASAVTTALQGQRDGIRSDLREFRDDIKGDVAGLRKEVGELKLGMTQGDGMFKLLDQRMVWLEKENERREAAETARLRMGHSTDTSRINRALADVAARESAKGGKSDGSEKSKLLISPKVINALILAFTTAAGASLWAIVEHAFSPAPSPQAVSSPAVTHPSGHAAANASQEPDGP